jgi:hypothetical protein
VQCVDEIPQNVLMFAAKQGRQIPHQTQVGLDGAALALDGGILDLQVGRAFASTVNSSARPSRLACRRLRRGAWRSARCPRCWRGEDERQSEKREHGPIRPSVR